MKKYLLAVFLCSSFMSNAQLGEEFKCDCKIPFRKIAVKRAIDDTCGIYGTAPAANTDANRLQNSVKNNLCARGRAKSVTVNSLKTLHNKVSEAGVSFGNYHSVPKDRSKLQELGERKKVYFIGYIQHEKYSNTSSGENVNCKLKRVANNDIHIDLAVKQNEPDKCNWIAAEVIPHYRPASWTTSNLKKVRKAGLQVKITGQLFFDASHGACVDGYMHKGSAWEIHPVYIIKVRVDGKWVHLDKWVESL